MSIRIRLMPLCAIVVLSAFRTVAGQTTVPPAQVVVVPAAPQGPAVVDRATYKQRAEGEMRDWELKLNAFYGKAKATGERDGTIADEKLKEAWAKTKEADRGLEAAGRDTWDGARNAYEAASGNLASAWQSAQQRL
jgi:hypothetical protein